MLGLIISSVILTTNPVTAIVFLLACITLLVGFLFAYFDNSTKTIDLSQIKELKYITKKENLERLKEYSVEKIKAVDLGKVAHFGRFLLLKPRQIQSNVTKKELLQVTKESFMSNFRLLTQKPYHFTIFWLMMVIAGFGFWDTFVATFQVDFLSKLITINHDNILVRSHILSGYILLGVLVIPVFVMQNLFAKLSKSIGVFTVITAGICLSGVSIFFFGSFSNIGLVMLFGFLNSFGFAATMPLAQATFLEVYNTAYAEKYNLAELDSHTSAAPLKMFLNLANVLGLVIGGMLVSGIGFNQFFLFFGVSLLVILGVSLAWKKKINV